MENTAVKETADKLDFVKKKIMLFERNIEK